MTTPAPPFAVTPSGRATSRFSDLPTAQAYALRLRDVLGLSSVITDGTG